MSTSSTVPTQVLDKNGKLTTVHKNPDMSGIKNKIRAAAVAIPKSAIPVVQDFPEDLDRASLPVQQYIITSDNVAKFTHVIKKANARLERGGLEERFTYEFNSEVIRNEDGTHREVVRAVLNKPVIKIGDWSFAATHEFTPAGDVISYWSSEGNFDSPVDAHCDQCGKNRRRERVYTVTNNKGETKQIGSNCLALFLGVRPEGLWTLDADKIDEELSELEGNSLGGSSGITHPLQKIIGVALRVTNNGAEYISRIAGTREKPSTADTVSMELETGGGFDQADVDSVIDFIRNNTDDSDYMENLKAAFGEGNEVFVKARHMGIAVSAVSAWYRSNNKAAEKAARIPATAEYVGVPKERIKTPDVYSVHKRFSYQSDYGTVVGFVLRDKDNRQLLWRSSGETPDVWEGGTMEISAFTVKAHEIDTYTGDHQTSIQRAAVSEVKNYGSAPSWKVSQIIADHIAEMPEGERDAQYERLEQADDLTKMKTLATSLTGALFD